MPAVLESIQNRARARRRRIVLPEVNEPRTSRARRTLEEEGLADVVWVEDPTVDPRFDQVVEHLHGRRRAPGLDRDDAVELATRPLFFAASLVALGEADGTVAGSRSTTAEVIRAGLYCVGSASGIDLVSSMFLMVRDNTVYSYADCAVVPDPTPQQLAVIAETTARNHLLLTGSNPRVAFLSYSTKGSAEHDHIDKVRQGLQLFHASCPEIVADGELQFDAAIDPKIADRKAPGSSLEGDANVLVFPDLDAGNLAYKISQRLGGFMAFGPILQGLTKPCLDLSRGCTTDDIVQVAAIAAVMSEPAT